MKGALPSQLQTHRFGPGKQSRKTVTAFESGWQQRPRGCCSGTISLSFRCPRRFVLDSAQQFAFAP
jgi:hypothetical protein